MKVRQTTTNIDDLKDEVERAISRFKEQKPINIYAETVNRLSTQLDEIIETFVDNDQFERLVKCYFDQIGADLVYIPDKKNGEAEADADVIARFDKLKLEICVQAKHYKNTTGAWAVTQISKYMEQGEKYQEADDPSYTSIAWVISSGKDFSDEAYESAMTHNVRLINGAEFRQMLVDAGMSKMILEFGES